jgi:eukaryotic-like serine/threonine-protein kinase
MLSTGEIIDGKYRIVRLIGEGGMGAVYEGENMRIHRRVAIKVLHAAVASQGEAVARFEREAQAAGRIGSDHIVEVIDLGALPSGDRYLVMEFLDGEGLGARIKARGRLAPAELLPIARQLLVGLGAAHGAGIIHRDLKPDNVFLLRSRNGHSDFVKLLDFGISKFSALGGDSGFSMTRTGAVMGTPYYMAPEQAKGSRELDHRVDLYAVGVILYEALTGAVPFNADTFNELLFKIVLEEARPLEVVDPTIDRGFAAIVSKAMAREPALRFQSASEFVQALEQWSAGGGHALVEALGLGAPPPTLSASALLGRGPGALTAPTLGTGTPGTWAQTGPKFDTALEALPKKSQTGLFVALGAVGLLVVGGGSFFAISALRASGEAEKAAAAAAASAQKAAEETARTQKVELEAEKAKTEAAAREADRIRADAERAKADAEAAKASAAALAASASAAALAPKPRVAVAPRPTAKPAAKPNPASGSTTSGGRKIRTSL